eukprot:s450_g2.t1
MAWFQLPGAVQTVFVSLGVLFLVRFHVTMSWQGWSHRSHVSHATCQVPYLTVSRADWKILDIKKTWIGKFLAVFLSPRLVKYLCICSVSQLCISWSPPLREVLTARMRSSAQRTQTYKVMPLTWLTWYTPRHLPSVLFTSILWFNSGVCRGKSRMAPAHRCTDGQV